MGHKHLQPSTRKTIRFLSHNYQNSTFTKGNLPMECRTVLGPLSICGYVAYNRATGNYNVTDAGHYYVRRYMRGDDIDIDAKVL